MQNLRILIKIYRKVLKITIPIIFILGAFIIWSSWPNIDEDEHAIYIENEFSIPLDTDSTYSIISYNIGYLSGMTNNLPVERSKSLFEDNLKKVYSEFEELQADILCFQEIDYHSKRSLYVNQQEEIQKLGYNYVYQVINWDVKYLPFPTFPISAHFGEILSGQSILSKYELTETSRIVLDRIDAKFTNKDFLNLDSIRIKSKKIFESIYYLDRLAQIVKVNIDGKTVVIINVHLEAFDTATRMKQTNRVAELYTTYKDDYPVLIVGDFNSDIDYENPSIQSILILPNIRSAVILGKKTFPSSNPKERLDYIFYNENFIKLKSAKVLNSFGEASDHLPIMMEFTLK